jgi:hypothetical protein
MNTKLLAPADLPSEEKPQVSNEVRLEPQAISTQSSGEHSKSGSEHTE